MLVRREDMNRGKESRQGSLKEWVREGIRRGVLTAGVYWVLALGVAAPAPAQGPSDPPPKKRDCNTIERNDFDSRAEWINARIDCKHENVSAEIFTYVDQATGTDGLFTETQKENLKRARERAEKARKRSKEAGSFKSVGRKQKSECYLQEYDNPTDPNDPDDDGDNDGVCTNRRGVKETCAEVIGDQIGNDDGVCRGKEACVEICDQPSNDQDDDNFDEDATADLEQALDDAEKTMAEANQQMAASLRLLALSKRVVETTAQTDDCLELLQGTRLVNSTALGIMGQATATLTGIHNQCDSAANQDVLGNNGSIVCVVTATLAAISELVEVTAKAIDDDVTGMRFDASMACMMQMDVELKDALAQLGDVSAELEELQDKVDALTDLVNRRFDEVVGLLKTPQGRRSGFPANP